MYRRRSIALSAPVALALALAACGGGSDASVTPAPPAATDVPAATDAPPAAGACAPSTDTPTVTVAMAGFAFDPGRVIGGVGDVIGFTNSDGAPHSATLDDGSCTTENLGNGQTGSLTFSAPGEYPFHCRIHPDMTGTIEIRG
jgi:plastocyanin